MNFTVRSAGLRAVVDPHFKSWNIDGSLNRQWASRDPPNRTLRSLARQSLPGYLRFGGGGNDVLRYALDMADPSPAGKKYRGGPPKPCVSRAQFDDLYGFADAAGAKLVFGLAMPQSSTHTWDATDARALMMYAIASNKTFFAFELGNEQCGVFTAVETAKNFVLLSALLAELYPDATARPKIIGPDPWGFHQPFEEDAAGRGVAGRGVAGGGASSSKLGRDGTHDGARRQLLNQDQRLQFMVTSTATFFFFFFFDRLLSPYLINPHWNTVVEVGGAPPRTLAPRVHRRAAEPTDTPQRERHPPRLHGGNRGTCQPRWQQSRQACRSGLGK